MNSSRWFEGPFSKVFGGPVARVIDEANVVGNMEQTVSMLATSTNLDYKTVKSVLEHLISIGYVKRTRKVGNAQTYRFLVENDMHVLLNCSMALRHRKACNSR